MRGLSLYQPWATLVAVGAKRIETRAWGTDYRGPVAIHATRLFPDDAILMCRQQPFRTALVRAGVAVPADLPRGAVLAVAHLHRVGRITHRSDGGIYVHGHDLPESEQEIAFGDYTPGRFGWVFTNIRALPEAVTWRGAQGLWNVPDELLALIEGRQAPPSDSRHEARQPSEQLSLGVE